MIIKFMIYIFINLYMIFLSSIIHCFDYIECNLFNNVPIFNVGYINADFIEYLYENNLYTTGINYFHPVENNIVLMDVN